MRSTYNRTIQDYIIYYIQNNLLNHWIWIKNAWLGLPRLGLSSFRSLFSHPVFHFSSISHANLRRFRERERRHRRNSDSRLDFAPASDFVKRPSFVRVTRLYWEIQNCIRTREWTNRGREKARGGFDERSQDFIFIGEQTIEIENLRDRGTRWYILLVRSHSIVERRRTKVGARRNRETPRSKDLGERFFSRRRIRDQYPLSISRLPKDCDIELLGIEGREWIVLIIAFGVGDD